MSLPRTSYALLAKMSNRFDRNGGYVNKTHHILEITKFKVLIPFTFYIFPKNTFKSYLRKNVLLKFNASQSIISISIWFTIFLIDLIGIEVGK